MFPRPLQASIERNWLGALTLTVRRVGNHRTSYAVESTVSPTSGTTSVEWRGSAPSPQYFSQQTLCHGTFSPASFRNDACSSRFRRQKRGVDSSSGRAPRSVRGRPAAFKSSPERWCSGAPILQVPPYTCLVRGFHTDTLCGGAATHRFMGGRRVSTSGGGWARCPRRLAGVVVARAMKSVV